MRPSPSGADPEASRDLPPTDGGGRFGGALLWAFAMKWGQQGMAALVRLVLMALLGVEDFGVVGMAWLYLTFLELILDQGFAAALIQRKDLRQSHKESIFWIVLAASFVLCGVSIALSEWWASVNDEPSLAGVIVAMSVVIPIQGLTTVQVALLQRAMDFRSLAIRNFIAVGLSGVVGIGLALNRAGVWALVGQQLVHAVAALLLLWRLSRWRPRFRFSAAAAGELLGFSTNNFVARLGVFAGNHADQILIGVLFGAFAVGIYRSAMGLMSLVVDLGTRAIGTVSFPQFARHQDDPEQLRADLSFCIWLSATIMIPTLAVLAGVSDALMAMLGERWADAANVLAVLCAVGVAQALTTFVAPLLQGLGRARTLAGVVWATAIVSNLTYVAVGLAAQDAPEAAQPLYVALARGLLFLLVFVPVSLVILRRASGFPLRNFFEAISRAVPAGGVAYAAIALLRSSGGIEGWPAVVQLGLQGAVGVAFAGLILFAFDPQVRARLADWRAS